MRFIPALSALALSACGSLQWELQTVGPPQASACLNDDRIMPAYMAMQEPSKEVVAGVRLGSTQVYCYWGAGGLGTRLAGELSLQRCSRDGNLCAFVMAGDRRIFNPSDTAVGQETLRHNRWRADEIARWQASVGIIQYPAPTPALAAAEAPRPQPSPTQDLSPVWFLIGNLLQGFASGYVQSQASRPIIINQTQPRPPLRCQPDPVIIGAAPSYQCY